MSIAGSDRGDVWGGTQGFGAFRFDGVKFTYFTAEDGLAGNVVPAVVSESDDTTWFGTSQGLSRLRGSEFTTYTRSRDHLIHSRVRSLFRDSKGTLWIGTARGITRYDGTLWASLSERDGLIGGVVHTICEDLDGNMWFGTNRGVSRYRPNSTPPNSPTVLVKLDEDYADLTNLPPITSGRRVVFSYQSVDLNSPADSRWYRYQIVPKPDRDNLPVGGWSHPRRQAQLEWTAAAPGDYTLAVQYIDRDLNYSAPTLVDLDGFSAGAVDYITKPFNAPELLARVRTHLELQCARRQLRKMNEEKNEFMGIAAHDLRNPLSAIAGYAEMIIEDAQDLRHEDLQANGKRILETAGRMVEMVQNLLDVNTIERGEFRLEPQACDLGRLTVSVVNTYTVNATSKQQTIAFKPLEEPAMVMADPNVLTQVLENLVSNAVKYSPPGNDIVVRLKADTESARFEVQDHGPGLTPADQEKLFGKFARLSAKPTGGEQSTGLGLSIVKKMVEAMDGKVWCESEPGQGALFIVQLPRA